MASTEQELTFEAERCVDNLSLAVLVNERFNGPDHHKTWRAYAKLGRFLLRVRVWALC